MPNRLMQFFTPIVPTPEQSNQLQSIQQNFRLLAALLDDTLPDNDEKTVATRYLLEAKESAVRAVLYAEPSKE